MRHTRAGVVERAVREFEALDGLIERLQPEDWTRLVPRPETRDPWTLKDALVHIVYWKAHSARAFRGEKRPPETQGLDVPRLNHLIWEQWRDRSPEVYLGGAYRGCELRVSLRSTSAALTADVSSG